jgi:hypothetical protein
MFGVDWSDPQTLWLNLTNLGLGVVVLTCIGVVGYGVLRDLLARRRSESQDEAGNVASHAFHTPELGWTMADGGEPEKPVERPSPRRRKGAK